MAESEVSLVNRALILIGAPTITAITDDNRSGKLANHLYSQVRDDVLSEANWNCAVKRAAMAAVADAPTWGFTTAFQLPTDFIRLIAVEDVNAQFSIEEDKLLTDDNAQNIKYVFRLTDVSKMDDTLKKAIAYKLAFEMSLAMKGSTATRDSMFNLYTDALAEGRHGDATQAPIETLSGSAWVDARTGQGQPFRHIAS